MQLLPLMRLCGVHSPLIRVLSQIKNSKPTYVIMTSNIDWWGPSIINGEYLLTGQEEIPKASSHGSGTKYDHASGNYCNDNIVVNAQVLTTMHVT